MRELLRVLLNSILALQLVKRKHKNKNMISKLDGSEASMIPLIADNAADLIEARVADFFSFSEFSVGRGIADVYIVSKNQNTFSQRKRSQVPAITDKFQNEIVSLLSQNNGTPYKEIGELLRNRGLHNLNTHLQQLLEQKALFLDGGRVFVQESASANIIEYSVAIEAKVSDWKKGLKQALRYKNFADKSYLALYESHIRTAKNNLDIFKTLNIGLIGVDDGGINIYFDPEANIKDPVKTRLASERVYSLIDDAQNSFMARNNLTTYRSAA